ncbi:unnamed protein product [Rotaria magnacalcarata]|uniref:Uncharacterized protein n=1 Tax=Rotaria magnacalcarata TaxID=392030 RepID=A0A816Q265_9BILA|nr:unnamed protein product [Rotaria magnacalcarata]CAF4161643.1 unnamed protein product [Rotaria magnacalcarata]
MTTIEDYTHCRQILQNAVELVQQTSTIGAEGDNAPLNIDINNFSCSTADDVTMEKLTRSIGNLFRDCLVLLSENYQEYMFNFLFEYQYDKNDKQFKENLTIGNLPAFLNDLEAIRDSFDAFNAAWDGELPLVKQFLTKYPRYKDRFGPWGTTFLYSAAKNGHIKLVIYLITDVGCSVNAQNQQHFERALLTEFITAADFKVSPKAGSTALHGACFAGHLNVVKYLVEHGASYFIRNQAEETPLDNVELNSHITEYFKTIINAGYSKQRQHLPQTPISHGNNQPGEDCIWEYKQLLTDNWVAFNGNESKQLSESLVVKPGKQFQQDVHLSVDSADYSVSTSKFLSCQRCTDQNANLAWVRCRGSSILNFDCYALWQIAFTKHPKFDSNNTMDLEFFDLPTTDDVEFQAQLNAWYNCDAKTNSLLDEAINKWGRWANIHVDYVTDEELMFDLLQFSFQNKDNNISGFIRWIPKLISISKTNRNHVTNIDNFQLSSNSELIPLTTLLLKSVLQTATTNIVQEEQEQILTDDVNYDNDVRSDSGNREDDPDDSTKPQKKVNEMQLFPFSSSNKCNSTVLSHVYH